VHDGTARSYQSERKIKDYRFENFMQFPISVNHYVHKTLFRPSLPISEQQQQRQEMHDRTFIYLYLKKYQSQKPIDIDVKPRPMHHGRERRNNTIVYWGQYRRSKLHVLYVCRNSNGKGGIGELNPIDAGGGCSCHGSERSDRTHSHRKRRDQF
jgi:hypothetical protein